MNWIILVELLVHKFSELCQYKISFLIKFDITYTYYKLFYTNYFKKFSRQSRLFSKIFKFGLLMIYYKIIKG